MSKITQYKSRATRSDVVRNNNVGYPFTISIGDDNRSDVYGIIYASNRMLGPVIEPKEGEPKCIEIYVHKKGLDFMFENGEPKKFWGKHTKSVLTKLLNYKRAH